MVFAKTWEDFEIAAEAMLMENPEKCRYSMKYSHNKQTLILKVTNNAKVRSTSFLFDSILIAVHCFSAYNTKQTPCQSSRRLRSSPATS